MKRIIFLLLLFCFLFYCKKSEDIHFYISGGPFVNRSHHFPIDTLGTYDSTLTFRIYTEPINENIKVVINGDTLPPECMTVDANSIYVDIPISADSSPYNLEVNSDISNAYAVCTLPGRFKIPNPPSLYITPGADCAVHWEKAIYAQWYEVKMSYFDTTHPPVYTWDTTYILNDTDTSTIIVSGEKIYYPGTFIISIDAVNGPVLTSENDGNVKGDGSGYWTARSRTQRAVKVGYW